MGKNKGKKKIKHGRRIMTPDKRSWEQRQHRQGLNWSGGDLSLVKGVAAKGTEMKLIMGKLQFTRKVDKESIADTGATVVCEGIIRGIGLEANQLLPTYMTLYTADKKELMVMGTVPVFITAQCVDGTTSTHREMLYFLKELSCVFLCKDALVGLGAINKEFPKVQSSVRGWVAGVQGSNAYSAINHPCNGPDNYEGEIAECGCPVRVLPPEPPAMPCQATEENKEQLKQFLLDTYRASTFNTCQHHPLPMMHGPPLELFIQKDA